MNAPAARAVVVLSVVYLVAGIALGALAGQAASESARVAWRRTAWIVSAIAFGAHIAYEQMRVRSSPRETAFRASAAAALGAFGLAVAANVHARAAAAHRPSLLLVLSLAIWPVMTALPAFAVAWVAALLLSRGRGSAS